MSPKVLIEVEFIKRHSIGMSLCHPNAYMHAPKLPDGVAWAVGHYIDVESKNDTEEGFFERVANIEIDAKNGNTKICVEFDCSHIGGTAEELKVWLTDLGFYFCHYREALSR